MIDPREPFLAAICATPEDDGPRLIYSDWLEERGDAERAEFIRVQCKLARLDPRPMRTMIARIDRGEVQQNSDEAKGSILAQAAYDDLEKRERELLPIVIESCKLTVSGPGGDWSWLPQKQSIFRRGFVDEYTTDAEFWMVVGDAILAAHPVQVVRLTTWPDTAMWDQIAKDFGDGWLRSAYSESPAGLAFFKWRWPTVKTWHLPTQPAQPVQTRDIQVRIGDEMVPMTEEIWRTTVARLARSAARSLANAFRSSVRRVPRDTGTLRSSIPPFHPS